MKKLISTLVLASSLAACGGPQIQYVPQNKYVPIPTNLTVNCHVSAPQVTIGQYILLDWPGKEDALTKLNRSLYGDIADCNQQMTALRLWDQKQNALYNGVSAAPLSMGNQVIK